MKRFLLFLVLIIIVVSLGFFFFKATKEKVKQDFARPIPYPTPLPSATPPAPQNFAGQAETTSLFVPYWSLKETSGSETYDKYIYFGITPNKDGIDMKEQGAKSLDQFLLFVPNDKKKLLALRMIEADTNFAILKNPAKQNTVISQTIELAKSKKFDGIVLDLEVTAIPFESLVKQITEFTALFYKKSRDSDLEFSIAIYGDVFYRVRPFDIKALGRQADHVMIMAYDFSKSKGNPGPNFPLFGEEEYGYDLGKMVADFSKVVPLNKLTVIFGLFGYDWQVDKQGRTLAQAKALTLAEIQKKFIDNCVYRSCTFSRDSVSLETEVHYIDQGGRYHIVWFEDTDSVAAKKGFLKSRGIGSFSYWAHSYF